MLKDELNRIIKAEINKANPPKTDGDSYKILIKKGDSMEKIKAKKIAKFSF